MLKLRANLQQKLLKEKRRSEKILEQAYTLLSRDSVKEQNIIHRITRVSEESIKKTILLDKQDEEHEFGLREIEAICVRYRLRFLDSSLFKGEIPYDAIQKTKRLEKKYNVAFESFKIIAPSSLFKLKDCNQDPLLFAHLGNNKYLLIHKWGNDLNKLRALFYLPVQSIYTFFYSVIILGCIIGASIPSGWINANTDLELNIRLWLSVHSMIGLFGILIFIGAVCQANFSAADWNSKFLNT